MEFVLWILKLIGLIAIFASVIFVIICQTEIHEDDEEQKGD